MAGRTRPTAIMTTDTVAKRPRTHPDGWSVGGMAKGAGMLAPGLATMLERAHNRCGSRCRAARCGAAEAARVTFDRVDSDGCMSTNDTVLLPPAARRRGVAVQADLDAASGVASPAQLIADAEGANHDVAIRGRTPPPRTTPSRWPESIARSNLLKCAIFGNDPNWGRVLAADRHDRGRVRSRLISTSRSTACRSAGRRRRRRPRPGRSERPRGAHRPSTCTPAEAEATVWTNDLTHDYVTRTRRTPHEAPAPSTSRSSRRPALAKAARARARGAARGSSGSTARWSSSSTAATP
jgi:glutamate N-acetyltransferase/amino-acid N-acetyltransferase